MWTKLSLILLLFLAPSLVPAQKCYELDNGSSLKLFSPFLGGNPRSKGEIPGANFGDTSTSRSCNGVKKRWVIGIYAFSKAQPIFAVHSGIATVYTTSSFIENNQGNDALWINGDSITTAYMGIIPKVATGQYVYAGQEIGTVFIDANLDNNFGIGIRHAPVLNPFIKRGYLPVVHDGTGDCKCGNEPLWPEHFVDPSSPFIDYYKTNDQMPTASLKVNINPSGTGKWSFDDGVTWYNGGEKISDMPFGFYKIIFKNEFGYTAPPIYKTELFSTNKDLVLDVNYTPDYSILKKPAALLQREKDQKILDSLMSNKMDSFNYIFNSNEKSDILQNRVIDSLNRRFDKIENIQKDTLLFTKLFKYLLPVLMLALAFVIILLLQNGRIRRQKRYLENLQKEQHHRVHNSLGVVSSLINKYKGGLDDEKLEYIENSILAIATVHRQLYKDNDLENINFQPVVQHLTQSILSQRGLDNEIETDIDAEIILAQKRSTTLALIYNELLTNSLKYAFEKSGNKKISFIAKTEGAHYLVTYKDNGKGYNEEFLNGRSNGFGRELLDGLAHQLRAKLDFFNDDGACCTLKF